MSTDDAFNLTLLSNIQNWVSIPEPGELGAGLALLHSVLRDFHASLVHFVDRPGGVDDVPPVLAQLPEVIPHALLQLGGFVALLPEPPAGLGGFDGHVQVEHGVRREQPALGSLAPVQVEARYVFTGGERDAAVGVSVDDEGDAVAQRLLHGGALLPAVGAEQ